MLSLKFVRGGGVKLIKGVHYVDFTGVFLRITNEKKLIWTQRGTFTPMQYTAIFNGRKNGNSYMKKCNIFSYFCIKHR